MIEINCIPVIPNSLYTPLATVNGGALPYSLCESEDATPVFNGITISNAARVLSFKRPILRFVPRGFLRINRVKYGISSQNGKVINDFNIWTNNIKHSLSMSYDLLGQVGITCGIPVTYKTTI